MTVYKPRKVPRFLNIIRETFIKKHLIYRWDSGYLLQNMFEKIQVNMNYFTDYGMIINELKTRFIILEG